MIVAIISVASTVSFGRMSNFCISRCFLMKFVSPGQQNKASANEMPSVGTSQSHNEIPEAVPSEVVERTNAETVTEKAPIPPPMSVEAESHGKPIWSESGKEKSLNDLQRKYFPGFRIQNSYGYYPYL